MTPIEQIKEQALQLEQALLTNNPNMPVLLRAIHTQIRADPSLITCLSDEEVNRSIVRGLIKQTGTEVAAVVKKQATKRLSSMSVEDLMSKL